MVTVLNSEPSRPNQTIPDLPTYLPTYLTYPTFRIQTYNVQDLETYNLKLQDPLVYQTSRTDQGKLGRTD